jgi:hypothetical protein
MGACLCGDLCCEHSNIGMHTVRGWLLSRGVEGSLPLPEAAADPAAAAPEPLTADVDDVEVLPGHSNQPWFDARRALVVINTLPLQRQRKVCCQCSSSPF